MKIRTAVVHRLLVSAAALAVASPAWAQTEEEAQAQAAPQPPAESGQGDLIIVTATKRATTVQDVPFSINAQTQEDIQRANASTIEEISRNVAGLAVQNLGPGQSQVSVRGVSAGQIVRDQPGVKEQVGVYLDESVVSLSLFTPDFDLFDLNRVETLRGPQGTLFGSGSVGGTVRYITNQPRLGRFEGLVEGNLNWMHEMGGHVKGAINVPIGETVAVRAVGYFQEYAGFIDAIGDVDESNVNDGQRYGMRVSMLFQPTDELRITPRVVYQKVTTDGFNRAEFYNMYANEFTLPAHEFGKREQFLKLKEKFRDETLLADLTASYGFGAVELTSITSYIDRDILVSRDASALTHSVSLDLGLPAAVAVIPSNLRDTTDLKTWTQELRLASTGEGPFQWLVGGFYSDIERDYAQRLPTPGYDAFVDQFFLTPQCLNAGPLPSQQGLCRVTNPIPALRVPKTSADFANGFGPDSPYNADLPYDIKQKAVFGEASYDFGEFKVTAGARYYDFEEVRDFVSGGYFSAVSTSLGDETSSNGISPRIIATWEPNRNLSVNVQAAKGFRLGGVNDPLNLPLCSDQDEALFGPFAGGYDDETLWNYEAGAKYSKGPITVNGAIFHTKIKDLQVTLDAGSCSSRIVFNVDKAHTTGAELEIAATPFTGLDLSVAGSYVSAEFDTTLSRVAGVPDVLTIATGIREGNRLPSVPKFQMAATATYGDRFGDTGDWYVSASFQHVGSRYTQPADQENNPRTFTHGLPFNGAPANAATTVDLKLPSYQLFNLSAGVELDSGLEVVGYINNLFDENPKLAFDRERGGRARLGYHVGNPRQIGVTVRQKFGQ